MCDGGDGRPCPVPAESCKTGFLHWEVLLPFLVSKACHTGMGFLGLRVGLTARASVAHVGEGAGRARR